MGRIRNATVAVAALGAALVTSENLQAQERPATDPPGRDATSPDATLEGATVTLKVDGMACPFCAYGLEKRLKEVPAVDAVLILVSDGLVQIRLKEGQSLHDDALGAAVDRAGFTLTEIQRITH